MHDHEIATDGPVPSPPPRRAADPAGHPLLHLQQQAGNAAVSGLVGVHRHSLDPEDEGGSV